MMVSTSSDRSKDRKDESDDLICQNQQRLSVVFPLEVWLKIATYMDLQTLNCLSQCHSHLSNFIMCRNLRNEKTILFSLRSIFMNKEKIQEDDAFRSVQLHVWKPLLMYYFPLFNKDLNVKNFMLVLKRRVKYIIMKKPFRYGKIVNFQNQYGETMKLHQAETVYEKDCMDTTIKNIRALTWS